MDGRVLDYEPLEKSVAELCDNKIKYDVHPNWTIGNETQAQATLYWDQKKNSWLAIVSGEFLEGYSQGSQKKLPFSKESVFLNTSACEKILEAYKIDHSKVKIDDVSRLAPSHLESLSK